MCIALFCMVAGSETVRTFTNKCLIKFLRSVGLMLSQLKNGGGVCKRNQCKPSCRNGRESGIQKEGLTWNSQGKRRRGGPIRIWRRTVGKVDEIVGRAWTVFRAIAGKKPVTLLHGGFVFRTGDRGSD